MYFTLWLWLTYDIEMYCWSNSKNVEFSGSIHHFTENHLLPGSMIGGYMATMNTWVHYDF